MKLSDVSSYARANTDSDSANSLDSELLDQVLGTMQRVLIAEIPRPVLPRLILAID